MKGGELPRTKTSMAVVLTYACLIASMLVTVTEAQSYPDQFIDPREPVCGNTKYYDTSIYACQECGQDALQDPNDIEKCICPVGYIKTEETASLFKFDCISCKQLSGDANVPNQDST
jgi:hypothetical protein